MNSFICSRLMFFSVAILVAAVFLPYNEPKTSLQEPIFFASIAAGFGLILMMISLHKYHENNVQKYESDRADFYRLLICLKDRNIPDDRALIYSAVLKNIFTKQFVQSNKSLDILKDHPIYELLEKVTDLVKQVTVLSDKMK